MYHNKNRFEVSASRYAQKQAPQCRKCRKIGHYGQDCRSSRYATRFTVSLPEGRPRINAIEKNCNYCKKIGRTRQECWLLHNRPGNRETSPREMKPKRNFREIKKGSYRENQQAIKDTQSSDEDKRGGATATTSRTAIAYRITYIRRTLSVDTGLDLISLPVQEAERNRIEFLFDTGATVSLIKLKTLKEETKIYDEQIKLFRITRHSIITLGKTYLGIYLRSNKALRVRRKK